MRSNNRDSDDSAPAEYPPEQPEVDTVDDDGTAYGAEEADLEAALEKELQELDKDEADPDSMEGVEAPDAGPSVKEEDEDAGSEDLEADSSESDDDDLEDDEGGEGDDDVEMEEDGKPNDNNDQSRSNVDSRPQQHSEVMVH